MGQPNYVYRCDGSLLNAANTNLDGAGTAGTNIFALITGGGPMNSTIVNSATIKGTTSTADDIIRFFVSVVDGGENVGGKLLIKEVVVPNTIRSEVVTSFEMTVNFDNLVLDNTNTLYATTDAGQVYAVTVSAYDIDSFS